MEEKLITKDILIPVKDLLCSPLNLLEEIYDLNLILHIFFKLPLLDYVAELSISLQDTIQMYNNNKKKFTYTVTTSSLNNSQTNIIQVKNIKLQYNVIKNNTTILKKINLYMYRKLLIKIKNKCKIALNIINSIIIELNYSKCDFRHFNYLGQISKTKDISSLINLNIIFNQIQKDNIKYDLNIDKFMFDCINILIESYIIYVNKMLEICDMGREKLTNTFIRTLCDLSIYNIDNFISVTDNKIKIFCPYIKDISLLYRKNINKYEKCYYIVLTKPRKNNKWEFVFEGSDEISEHLSDEQVELIKINDKYFNNNFNK